MHELAAQIWRLEKVITLAQVAAADSPPALDGIDQAILEMIRDVPGIYSAQLAQRLAVTRMAMTKRIRGLATRGMVETTPDAADKRRLKLALTEPGMSALADLEELRSTNAKTYLADWNDDDAQHLIKLLTRLNSEIEANHPRDRPGWARGVAR